MSDTPTKPGFYWVRFGQAWQPAQIILMSNGITAFRIFGEVGYLPVVLCTVGPEIMKPEGLE